MWTRECVEDDVQLQAYHVIPLKKRTTHRNTTHFSLTNRSLTRTHLPGRVLMDTGWSGAWKSELPVHKSRLPRCLFTGTEIPTVRAVRLALWPLFRFWHDSLAADASTRWVCPPGALTASKLPLRGSSAFVLNTSGSKTDRSTWFLKTTREVGCRSSRCAARALPRASTLCSSSLVAHL